MRRSLHASLGVTRSDMLATAVWDALYCEHDHLERSRAVGRRPLPDLGGRQYDGGSQNVGAAHSSGVQSSCARILLELDR